MAEGGARVGGARVARARWTRRTARASDAARLGSRGGPRRSRSWCRCRAVRPGRRLQPAAGRRRGDGDRALVRRLRRASSAPFAWLLLAPSRTGHQRLGASLAFEPDHVRLVAAVQPADVHPVRREPARHDAGRPGRARTSSSSSTRMLPVSPHFPGLELATAGVHWLTGLPLFVCQVLVVVTARVTFVLALFLLASRIGRSTARSGAATVLLYAGERPVLLLQRPVHLPDRRDRDGHGRASTCWSGRSTVRRGAALDGCWSPYRCAWPRWRSPTTSPAGSMLVALWLLALFFWRGGERAPVPAHPAHRRARHGGGRWRGPRSSRRC